MKIRIQENSLRIRLLRSEVDTLAAVGYLEAETVFADNSLIYALQADDEEQELTADFIDNKITMFVPRTWLKDWATNSNIGFSANMPLSDTGSLFLLLEKDFVCTDNTTGAQSDNYINPNKTC